jgi:hypothetical protein
MPKSPQHIAEEIRRLVDQLVAIAQSTPTHSKEDNQISPARGTKGAVGALSILMGEGFFDSPKDLTSVMKRLQEIGRHYPQPSIAMNLLNLTRKRTLIRMKDGKAKTWEYVIRK